MRRFLTASVFALAFLVQLTFAEAKNDIYLSHTSSWPKTTHDWFVLTLILCLFFGSLIVFLMMHIRRIQKKIAPMYNIQEEITESILKGFEDQEFKMYLQFIVDTKTSQLVSAEALSRWDNREKGLLGPGHYIKDMENAGLISRHDFSMFENACQQLEKWNDTKYHTISISCNFTRITLSEENFIDELKNISDRYHFDKSKLAIEITEDAMEKDRETAMQNVRKCKDLGFRVYLDDLGSGYTSLANLCDYPIDVVKIDRDILSKADTPRGKSLFSGIVALAHNLNIKVICEGVETEEQNMLVASTDCDYIQGWYYTKALPLAECESFMEQYAI